MERSYPLESFSVVPLNAMKLLDSLYGKPDQHYRPMGGGSIHYNTVPAYQIGQDKTLVLDLGAEKPDPFDLAPLVDNLDLEAAELEAAQRDLDACD